MVTSGPQTDCIILRTGNPTYQTPAIVSFRMNATISGSRADAAGVRHSVSFPLFQGGDRRSQSDWADDKHLPLALMGQYTADQVQLLCLSRVLPPSPCAPY